MLSATLYTKHDIVAKGTSRHTEPHISRYILIQYEYVWDKFKAPLQNAYLNNLNKKLI